ncbi:MAG: flagellar motor switch protein FliG [Myxococcota bacterium]
MEALTTPLSEPLHPGLLTLDGASKSLLFLVSLDEAIATRVMSHLSPSEVGLIRKASESLEEVDIDLLLAIHREFISAIRDGVPTSLRGSGAYLRRLAGKALGEHHAAYIWDGVEREVSDSMATLSTLDVDTVFPMIEREHPQTLAVIFSLIDAERAAELLSRFSVDDQTEIMRRTAQLKSIPESVVKDIEEQLASEISVLGEVKRRELNGIEAATELLKMMDQEQSEALLEELADIDEEIAEKVRKALFTFEDLKRIDGRGMQRLLKEIQSDHLVLALKTASEEMREKVFGNISSRAAATLRDDLELMGPVRVSDVEEAQGYIVEAALRLERENAITIAREGAGALV